jgi:hypothetical protein
MGADEIHGYCGINWVAETHLAKTENFEDLEW